MTLLHFALMVAGLFSLLWGTEVGLPGSGASSIMLVAIAAIGVWFVRPGWNTRPVQFGRYGLILFGLLLASAVVAAGFLTVFRIPLPYDFATLKIAAAIPGIVAVAGIEELLFRQVLYRWLEQRNVSARHIVAATALAFGFGHLGGIVIGSPAGATFFLLQGLFMIWIGALLGEIRSSTGSWLMSWLGHFGYNVSVLYFLSVAH